MIEHNIIPQNCNEETFLFRWEKKEEEELLLNLLLPFPFFLPKMKIEFPAFSHFWHFCDKFGIYMMMMIIET